jgi:general secretion pathway protein L
VSLLRIFASLRDTPGRCRWALLGEGREPLPGEGPVASLPRRAERVQLVLPAADVLITRARLPETAKRRSGAVLAFAVEEQTLGDPDTHQVSWLGTSGGADVLAVLDRAGLQRWSEALEAVGIRGYEIHCETLLLPWTAGEWSLAWDGREGFVRTAELEGAPTDCAEPGAPPLSLRMMLDEAKSRGEAPASIAVYATAEEAMPDVEPWQRALGVALRAAGPWDWRGAPQQAGISLAQQRPRWRIAPGTLARLRPAAWIAGAALAIHAGALVADWTRLAIEQRSLRQRMEVRFRAAFPEAVAVVDPALQMRRKLAEARHAAGQSDTGDFLPMVASVAGALHGAQARGLQVVSYENGRLTLELAVLDEPKLRRVTARLLEAGLRADVSRSTSRGGRASMLLTVQTQ